ncbi:MAG: MATE family efflux transporter [Actinomycetota bacterium]|nr:MATE family efflux transporter [Actinomycetota bacterium]
MGRLSRTLAERDRRIVALAVPALGTLATEPLYVLVDTAIVGRLGTVPLGGLALASTVLTTLLWVFNFLAYGTTARVAFLMGRGDRRAAAGVAAQGLWLATGIGLTLAAAIAAGGRLLAGLLGGEGPILEAATTYLRISALGMPAVLVALVGHGYLRGLSDTRTPLLVVVVANVTNVVLEVLLVYGLDLGVAGSAWGTVVAQLLAAGWFAVLVGRRVVDADADLAPVWSEMRRLVVVGRHLFTRTGALLATLALSTAVAARVGPSTLGGHQIALQVFTFLALAVDALAIAAQALVGTFLGAGRTEEAVGTGRRLLGFGAVTGGAVGVVVAATAWLLPHVFTTDPAVAHRATVALLFLAALQVPAAVTFVLDGVLMGASDFRFLQWSTVAAALAFVPFAAAVLSRHRLGIGGIWAGLLAWVLVRAAANAVRFRRRRWMAVTASG